MIIYSIIMCSQQVLRVLLIEALLFYIYYYIVFNTLLSDIIYKSVLRQFNGFYILVV